MAGGKLNAIFWLSTLFADNNIDNATDTKTHFTSVSARYFILFLFFLDF